MSAVFATGVSRNESGPVARWPAANSTKRHSSREREREKENPEPEKEVKEFAFAPSRN
jgi:hypothetical protein